MVSFLTPEIVSLRSSLSRTWNAAASFSPIALRIAATMPSLAAGADQVHFGLPASATSALMVSIATCICWWPNMTAPSITSSDSSFASDSTISTALAVPATTSSRSESFSSLRVGLSRYWPSL